MAFDPDLLTQQVLEDVQGKYADHPGSLENFDWPLTPAQAEAALEDFVRCRGDLFGAYQDAMWQGEPWLWHSRLSVALNLKLIDPRTVIARVERAFREGDMPLAAAEGSYVRYWAGANTFGEFIGILCRNTLSETACKHTENSPHFTGLAIRKWSA